MPVVAYATRQYAAIAVADKHHVTVQRLAYHRRTVLSVMMPVVTYVTRQHVTFAIVVKHHVAVAQIAHHLHVAVAKVTPPAGIDLHVTVLIVAVVAYKA